MTPLGSVASNLVLAGLALSACAPENAPAPTPAAGPPRGEPAAGSVVPPTAAPPEEPGTVSGKVVNDHGAPMPDIRVRAYPEVWTRGRPWFAEEKTDALGRFRISGLLEETHRVRALRSEKPGDFEARLSSESVRGVVPPRSDLVLVLRTPGRLAGRLLVSPGVSASGLRVFVDPLEGEDAAGHGEKIRFQSWDDGTELTDDVHPEMVIGRMREDVCEVGPEGRFRSRLLLPGRHRVVVDDVRALPAEAVAVVPAGGEVEVEVPVRLRGAAEVRVADPAGNPVPGARVEFLDGKGEVLLARYEKPILGRFGGRHSNASRDAAKASALTDERGIALRLHLDPGPNRLRVRREGFAAHTQSVEIREAATTLVEIVLALPK